MTDDFINNENRARLRDSINTPTPRTADGGVASARPANDLPPSIRGDAPMTVAPHDGMRRRADNASAPTHRALHAGPVTPGYQGISPAVARELYKAPPAFAARIRDHAKNK
jgi:hypothetical protein